MSPNPGGWEEINTLSRERGGVLNSNPLYSTNTFKGIELDRKSCIFIDKGQPGQLHDQPYFVGKMRSKEDPHDINWQLVVCWPGDADFQRQPFVAIQLKLHRIDAATNTTYFGSDGVSSTHKIRVKFLPNTFHLRMRKLPQAQWNLLVARDVVARGEVLPPELLQVEFFLREGESPLLEGYPWPFEGYPHVMSTIQSQVAIVGPSCLKDLVKWHTFGLIMPYNNHTVSSLRSMGNVFFEKGGLIPYPRLRTAVHNNPFSTDLVWNLERFRLIIPRCQAEVPEPYPEVFRFDRFEDWAISASQGVVQDIFDLLLEIEVIRDIAHHSVFVRIYPHAETEEKRESEYWVLLKHELVSGLPQILLHISWFQPSTFSSIVDNQVYS